MSTDSGNKPRSVLAGRQAGTALQRERFLIRGAFSGLRALEKNILKTTGSPGQGDMERGTQRTGLGLFLVSVSPKLTLASLCDKGTSVPVPLTGTLRENGSSSPRLKASEEPA